MKYTLAKSANSALPFRPDNTETTMLETKKFDSLETLRSWIDDNKADLSRARGFTLIAEREQRMDAAEQPSMAPPPETDEKELKEPADDMAWEPPET